MKIKFKLSSFLFIIIFMSPFLSLFLDNTSFYYIVGPLVTFLIMINFCVVKDTKAIILCFISLIIIVYALLNTLEYGKVYNHAFSFINTVLLFYMFSKKKYIEAFSLFFKKHIKWIMSYIILANIVEILFLITGKGYMYRYSWGGTFFKGSSAMPHTLAYLMLITFILCLLLILETNNKLFSLLTIIPLYAIFESGARVVLLVTILISLLLIDTLFPTKRKIIIIRGIKALIIFIIIFLCMKDKIMESDLWNKIIIRSNSGNNSAGRGYMFKDMMNRFLNQSTFIQYFIGHGDDKTYLYNQQNYLVASSVWAHNDILQVIIGKGIIGLYIYIYSFIKFSKFIWTKKYFYSKIILWGSMIILMLLNGFYTYRDTSLGIPFIALLMIYTEEKNLTITEVNNE